MKHLLLLGKETSLGEAFYASANDYYNLTIINPQQNYQGQLERIKDRKLNPTHIVNCLGWNKLARIGDTDDQDEELLMSNVSPIYWLIDKMEALGMGPCRVLSVASQTYRVAQTNTAFYCASKAALVQLSKVMARELAGHGWVINCLAPGKIVDTKMAAMTDAQVNELRGWTQSEADAYALRNIPMRRFTDRKEVVEAILKILELPAYINGTCIDMTGGV